MVGPGPHFEQHIREAIALNRARLPEYARLTGGASKKISRLFILNQLAVLPITWWIDRRARSFQRAGVPVVALDMVSMSLAPTFQARSEVEPEPLSRYTMPPVRRIGRDVRSAYGTGDFAGAASVIRSALIELNSVPTYHAMVRHMLESALRSATLAPDYLQQVEALGLRVSPRSLSWRLVRLHLRALVGCALLDRLAAPIQADGIPILHRDVPPIPWA